jgi:hypothetical protein
METETGMRQVQTKPISAREMHKYVWILLGVFTLLAVTFPTAFIRVSKDKKFAAYNFHVKSLTLEGQLPKLSGKSPDFQPVVDKSSFRPTSGGNSDKSLNPSGASTASQEAQARHPSNPAAEITDTKQLATLNQKLYDQIEQVWQASRRRLDSELEYRLSVRQDGAIASYEPLNQAASDYLQQTPLPNLLVSSASDSASSQEKPFAFGQFRVVFTRTGIIEVSPWHGWGR